MPETDVVEVLNALIATSQDGEKRFIEAERLVHDVDLKRIFQRFSEDCAEATKDFEACLVGAGGYPDNTGSAAGTIHRELMNVRARIMPDEEKTVLRECSGAEDHTRGVFEAILKTDLPPAVRRVVEKQYAIVVNHHRFIHSLQERYGHTDL